MVHKKRWFTPKDFLGLYAISQVLPGPTGVSFCVLVGDRFFGLRGACAALAGFLVLPTFIVIGLASLFQQNQHLHHPHLDMENLHFLDLHYFLDPLFQYLQQKIQ
jgi:chromate transporter